MNRTDLIDYFEATTARMVETVKAKNADYTGASEDPFFNFTRVEALGIALAEVGFLTRLTDKFCRVAAFVKRGVLEVKDETVEDTLVDLAAYALLLSAYIKSKREKKSVSAVPAAPARARR